MCDCGEGAEIFNSLQLCDKVNGICQCKPGNVIGDRCDECEVSTTNPVICKINNKNIFIP